MLNQRQERMTITMPNAHRPLIEFDGPANWHCLGVHYVTLTHDGLKEQGEPHATMCETMNEAFAKFWLQFEEYSAGAEQIAWRSRPAVEAIGGKFIALARLARFPSAGDAT